MNLDDLCDDVIRSIIDQIQDYSQLHIFALTSRRMHNLARPALRRQCQFIFEVGRTPNIQHRADQPISLIFDLVHLIEKPQRLGLVWGIESRIRPTDWIRIPTEDQLTLINDRLDYLLESLPSLHGKLETFLSVLRSDYKNVNNHEGWFRMCMNVIYGLLWLCPDVRELNLRNNVQTDISRQLQDIGSRFRLEQQPCFDAEEPNPYNDIARLFKITRLRLGKLACCNMHKHPEAFNPFIAPSLRYIGISKLKKCPTHTSFWPPEWKHLCHARTVVVGFVKSLPSPFVISDLLGRCPSLVSFQLRRSILLDKKERLDIEEEWLDSSASEALRVVGRSDLIGIDGYANLITSKLGENLERPRLHLDYLIPCDRRVHRELDLKCKCVVLSIRTSQSRDV